ncbi:hypothetical protein Tco_0710379 [Tanacetum coccineum]
MFVLMLSYFIRVIDPNLSLGKICLGEDVVVILSDKVEGSGDWNSLEFQDTANSGQKKAMVFYQMDTEEVSDRFVAPCFVNGVEAYDGEINLAVEENMISNEYAAATGRENITDFGAGTVTIYPNIVPFLEETEEEEKSNDDWDHLLDFNIDDIPLLGEEGLLPFVCKIGKRMSSSAGCHLTQEEAAKEAIAIRMSQKFALLEEERSIIETMAYHDKYKKILDELGREDMKKVDRGIMMINRTQAEAMGILTNVLCQVEVTTLIAKFLILDILIDRYSPIVVGRGFLRTIGGMINTPERLFLTFDGFCHQTFRAARSDFIRNTKSDSDDEEEYQIKRNKFGAPIYGLKPASHLNLPLKQVNWKPDYKDSYSKEEEATGQWQTKGSVSKKCKGIHWSGFDWDIMTRFGVFSSEDPFEGGSRQLLEQAPHSPEYVPDPMELEDHVLVYIPEPEHPGDFEAPTPPLPPFFLSPRIRPPHTRAAMRQMRATAPSTYHLYSIGTPPYIHLSPYHAHLLVVGESSATAAARQPGPTIETRLRDTERRIMTALELVNRRRMRLRYRGERDLLTSKDCMEETRQAADDLAVQHIMRTQALEAGARVDTLEDPEEDPADHPADG